MYKTYVLPLKGHMISWPTGKRLGYRASLGHPTLSNVVGLLDAASGRSRDCAGRLDVYSGIDISVRVDDPGSRMWDFHTTNPINFFEYSWVDSGPFNNSKGSLSRPKALKDLYFPFGENPRITRREYINNSAFTLFFQVEADSVELGDKVRALVSPVFDMWAGRRSNMFSLPLRLFEVEGDRYSAAAIFPSFSSSVLGKDFVNLTWDEVPVLSCFKVFVDKGRPTGSVGKEYLMSKYQYFKVDPPVFSDLESFLSAVSVFDLVKEG